MELIIYKLLDFDKCRILLVPHTFGPDGKAERRNAELVRPLRDKTMRIIERIAIENNYAIVLDIAVVSPAYAKKSLDLTDKVMAELEKSE